MIDSDEKNRTVKNKQNDQYCQYELRNLCKIQTTFEPEWIA